MNEPVTAASLLSCADDYDPNSMPVDKAREVIARFLAPVTATERVPVRSALGRVLAEDVISPLDVPAHDNSAMDGYAVRHADLKTETEATLKTVGTAFAGAPFKGSLAAGQAVRIMTGGVVPVGADTIVMQEHVKADGDKVTIGKGHRQGQNLRKAGEDLAVGQVALKRGLALRPADTGLISSLGIGEVTVYRKLRVAFFSTGDELVSIGTQPAEGQIYDSNRYTIHGMLTRLGCDLIDMGVVRDDPALIERAFATAAGAADVVITSGGVSVGEADFIKDLLDKLGEVVFWKIAMKPGRPLAYGKIGGAHFFGLPGNPVSVMVTFYQFVRDALLVLSGRDPVPTIPTFKVPCVSSLKKAPGRTEFQRGILERDGQGAWSVRVTGEQGSGILRSMSEANCFIILPTDQGNVTPGTVVEVQVLEGIIKPVLAASGLECVRGERRLFADISFTLPGGSLLEVRGPNGSGKTSLLRMICGLLAPAAGEITWNGRPTRTLGEEYRGSLVYIGHLNAIKDELNPAENLSLSARLADLPDDPAAIAGSLQEFGLAGSQHLPCRLLSQGQRRRAALARLKLSSARPLWVLDEPSTALDAEGAAHLRGLMERHLSGGGIVVLTTHQDLGLSAPSVQRLELRP